MNDRSTEIRSPILELLSQIRMALGQLKLYPATSPQAQKAIAAAHAAVAAFPGGAGKIYFARTMRGLLVNSKRPPAGDASAMAEKAWLQVLHDAHVNSLAVLATVSAAEFGLFLDALSRRFWDLRDGKAINARLKENGVTQAWVEEVEFVAMAKGDLLIEGATAKLEAAGARVTEIVQTLEQVIDGTAGEGIAEQVRLEIVRKLLTQDPMLIQKATAMNFYAELEGGGGGGGGGDGGPGDGPGPGGGPGSGPGDGPGSGGGPGSGPGAGPGPGGGAGPGAGPGPGGGLGPGRGPGKGPGPGGLSGPGNGGKGKLGPGKLPGWIPFDQARKSLTEIARMLKLVDEVERERLRSIAHMILGSFRYDPLLRELLKKFLTDEGMDLIPAWMTEAPPEPEVEEPKGPVEPARRAADLLALPEDARIEQLSKEGVALIKELLDAKRADTILDLTKALIEHARHISTNHRLQATKLLQQVYPLLNAEGFEGSQAAIRTRLVAALELEKDRAIYPLLVDLSVSAIDGDVLRGLLEPTVPLLEALCKQQVEDKEYPERREVSARGVEKVVGGTTFPAILDKIRDKQPAALRAAEILGIAGIKGLIDRMRVSDAMSERIGLAKLILRTGPEGGSALSAELLRVAAPSEALKLLDQVRLAMSESQAESTLGATLRHPALAVRRRAAAFLKGGEYSRAANYFLEALRTENEPSMRSIFVESLGALRHESSLTLMGQILEAKNEPNEVRIAAATALARLGKASAIPILIRVGSRPRALTLVFSVVPPVVRAAAMRALSTSTHVPEVRDALRRALEDAEPAVRSAASEALRYPIVQALGEPALKATLVSDVAKLGQFSGDGATGYLSEVPLDQVCKFLEESGRTGLLSLSVAGSTALVHLRQGGVVSAEYAGFKGQDAFNKFCVKEGTCFLFIPGILPATSSPPRSLIEMMMDAFEIREP